MFYLLSILGCAAVIVACDMVSMNAIGQGLLVTQARSSSIIKLYNLSTIELHLPLSTPPNFIDIAEDVYGAAECIRNYIKVPQTAEFHIHIHFDGCKTPEEVAIWLQGLRPGIEPLDRTFAKLLQGGMITALQVEVNDSSLLNTPISRNHWPNNCFLYRLKTQTMNSLAKPRRAFRPTRIGSCNIVVNLTPRSLRSLIFELVARQRAIRTQINAIPLGNPSQASHPQPPQHAML
ncbi:hypothetical protein FKP32DRAFT_888564 [Trametes sanguinea]|nr:hypothetical protein FKP32DRAFT_888564 [Trametes sanguinea]